MDLPTKHRSLAACALAVCWPIVGAKAAVQSTDATVEIPTAPIVEVNHLYVTLDAETYAGLEASGFLRQSYSHVQQQTLYANETESWTGTYLTGVNAYIEMLQPTGGVDGLEEGFSGIAFSTQTRGDIDTVFEALRENEGQRAVRDLQTLPVVNPDDVPLPWFWAVLIDTDTEGGLSTWLLENHEAMLRSVGLEADENGFVSRADQIAAGLRLIDPELSLGQFLFGDIVGIDVDASPVEADDFAALLEAFGYVPTPTGDGTVFQGPGCEIRIRRVADPGYRIRRVETSLTRAVTTAIDIAFGPNASLRVGPGTLAEWRFGARAPGVEID